MARLDSAFETDGGQAIGQTGGDQLFELGLRYSAGLEVDMDLVEAHKWFNLAVLRGCDAARWYRSEIAGELSRADVAKAQRKAREWLQAN